MSVSEMTFAFRSNRHGQKHIARLSVDPKEVGVLSDGELIAAARAIALQENDMVVLVGIQGGKK